MDGDISTSDFLSRLDSGGAALHGSVSWKRLPLRDLRGLDPLADTVRIVTPPCADRHASCAAHGCVHSAPASGRLAYKGSPPSHSPPLPAARRRLVTAAAAAAEHPPWRYVSQPPALPPSEVADVLLFRLHLDAQNRGGEPDTTRRSVAELLARPDR